MIENLKNKARRESRNSRDARRMFFYTGMVVLLIVALSLKRCLGPAYQHHSTYIPSENGEGDSSFNWTTAVINYTPHAECRMECRHITKTEVYDILHNGKVNIAKSELNAPECERRFALDGYSKENQHLRIIAAHCGNKLTIITCIDLDHEWPCICGKDY